MLGWFSCLPDWSESFSRSLPVSANCQPHHRCWFIPLIIHKVGRSLLCWPDASLHCQSVSAAHWTGYVTDAEIRHKYFRKHTPETPSRTGCTSERTAMFYWPSSLFFSKDGSEMGRCATQTGKPCISLFLWLLLSNEHGGWWIFSEQIVEDIWPSFLSDAAEMSL